MGTIIVRFVKAPILIVLSIMIHLEGSAYNLDNQTICNQSDTLDPLPEWNYCTIITELDSTLPFLAPHERVSFMETYEDLSDLLTLDSVRVLAWCVRETISDGRKHGFEIRKNYTDFALLWAWFRYQATNQPNAAIIVMERDTGVGSMDHSWHAHVLAEKETFGPNDDNVLSGIILHPSARFFALPISDDNASYKAANELLPIMFSGDSLTRNGEVRNILQRGAIRRGTWKKCLGNDPPDIDRVD
jgi:hypothetical protein